MTRAWSRSCAACCVRKGLIFLMLCNASEQFLQYIYIYIYIKQISYFFACLLACHIGTCRNLFFLLSSLFLVSFSFIQIHFLTGTNPMMHSESDCIHSSFFSLKDYYSWYNLAEDHNKLCVCVCYLFMCLLLPLPVFYSLKSFCYL